ncbi:hypothetical protein GCM10011594_13420 [Nakamurella endophytica]|uniref:Uncharacterized protein n=1 Tax=Nakamurella endophytica TaxID=1748367 RepID=A0A917WE93_9ACTN|nr:hypothetical protein GCM10011594_13420 [Nakamurella endophytica]
MLVAAVVVSAAACGAPDPLRAYRPDGSSTAEFTGAVADFAAAVRAGDGVRLVAQDDRAAPDGDDPDSGTDAGVRDLLAAYGGRTVSVVSYSAIAPGSAGARLRVFCADGRSVTFGQGFVGLDGRWRPVIRAARDRPSVAVAGRADPPSAEAGPPSPAPRPGTEPYPPCPR